MKNVFVLLIFCLIVPLASKATNYYVNNNSTSGDVFCTAIGNNANAGTSSSAPKATLANVLSTYSAVLTSGDRIYIDAGTYSDANLSLNKAGIRITGAGPAKTVFDNANASADANAFANITANNITIDGILIKRYNRGTGGASAIQITGVTGITLNNVLTDNNKAGGGSSTIVITGPSSVTFNGGGSNCNSTLSVAGGGVNIEGSGNTVNFNNYSISRNNKDFQGGSGLYIDGASSIVTMTNSIIADNTNSSSNGGAAIYIDGGATLNVSGTKISNNSVSYSGGPVYGGAVTMGRYASVSFSNCDFQNNAVGGGSGKGGAIATNTAFGAGTTSCSLTLSTCSFSGNTANGGTGNDIYNKGGSITVTNGTFTNSTYGLNNSSGTFSLSNSGNPTRTGTFTGNTSAVTATPSVSVPVLQGSCYGVVLPVEFLDMRAVCVDDQRQLIWSTGSEHNNAYFTVESGNEFGEFEVLATINGAGNSNEEITYQLPVRDAAYYRLSQTDYDGTKVELKTISTGPCKDQGSEIVYLDQLHAFDLYVTESYSGDVDYALINSVGQVIERGSHSNDNNSVQRIFLSSFCSDGMYFLQVTAGSVVLSEKFMIRKQ